MYEELKAQLQDMVLDNHWTGIYVAKPSLEAIEQLERQLAERDAEIAKLIQAVADHVTVRSEQYAELQKYRDAPVLWAKAEDIAQGKLKKQSVNAWHKQYDCDTKLIVKPGEQ